MFGTLVIQLPSDYEGGMLRVRHRGEELTFDYSGLKGIMDFNYMLPFMPIVSMSFAR